MKQKDIAILIIVVFIAATLSFLITNALFVTKKSKVQSVQKIEKLSSEFNEPSTTVFNKDAVNPTQLINIGDNPAPSTP